MNLTKSSIERLGSTAVPPGASGTKPSSKRTAELPSPRADDPSVGLDAGLTQIIPPSDMPDMMDKMNPGEDAGEMSGEGPTGGKTMQQMGMMDCASMDSECDYQLGGPNYITTKNVARHG